MMEVPGSHAMKGREKRRETRARIRTALREASGPMTLRELVNVAGWGEKETVVWREVGMSFLDMIFSGEIKQSGEDPTGAAWVLTEDLKPKSVPRETSEEDPPWIQSVEPSCDR
jgi:hypothetical protein